MENGDSALVYNWYSKKGLTKGDFCDKITSTICYCSVVGSAIDS